MWKIERVLEMASFYWMAIAAASANCRWPSSVAGA
jgi:hypothetical protein